MLKKRYCDASAGRTASAANKASRLKLVVVTTGIAGILLVIAHMFHVRPLPAPSEPPVSIQRDEKPSGQIDGSEPLLLGSIFGCNSPAPPPVSVSVGQSSEETDTTDLGTPAAAVYSVLSLLDQGATDKLAPCLFAGTGDPGSSLYPRYLGPPVGLGEVIEDDPYAEVAWEATVHTEFSLRGKRWPPGETIRLTARLVRVEGLWELLQLHDGGEHGSH